MTQLFFHLIHAPLFFIPSLLWLQLTSESAKSRLRVKQTYWTSVLRRSHKILKAQSLDPRLRGDDELFDVIAGLFVHEALAAETRGLPQTLYTEPIHPQPGRTCHEHYQFFMFRINSGQWSITILQASGDIRARIIG